MRGDIDALESELRQHEQAQEDAAAQLTRAQEELKVARRDAEGAAETIERAPAGCPLARTG